MKLLAAFKALCQDTAHVSAVTGADCFYANRKRIRGTQENLHNSISLFAPWSSYISP